MNRTNSLRYFRLCDPPCPAFVGIRPAKSLPNILVEISSAPKKSTEIKRQNSKRGKIFQKTWDKVKTIIQPSTRRNSKVNKTYGCSELESPRPNSPVPKLTKYQALSTSAPSTPNSKKLTVFDFEPIAICPAAEVQEPIQAANPVPITPVTTAAAAAVEEEVDQVVKNYEKLQKRLSDELHQSIKEERKKEEALSDQFKKRLQQWDMWKASTGKYHYTDDELQKLIPSDFSKKLQEWEDLKTRPREARELLNSTASISQSGKKSQRKRKSTDEVCRQKELAWLDKQLEKIEIEKKRLEREMKKNCEKEARLEKLKEALKNSPGPKQEVWIKTPTAECKVEGINEKFAKKLCKWEEKQGIEPESSTMALLNPKYYTPTPEPQSSTDHDHDNAAISDHEEEELLAKRDYTTSDESEGDAEADYEGATDSFATKDEGASGASNTDSECFNLKPSYRRRSSDALSTPISACSPSLSGCTSDDEENIILKTVKEIEEEFLDEKPPILKAKPILVGDNEDEENRGSSSSVIVQTKRTIFTPVLGDNSTPTSPNQNQNHHWESRIPEHYTKMSPPSKLFTRPPPYMGPGCSEPIWKQRVVEPPRVVGVVRKGSSYDFPGPLPNYSASPPRKSDSRPNFPKMGGKIPVWCSPLMARRKYQVQEVRVEQPGYLHEDFTIDKFLQQTNINLSNNNGHPHPPPAPGPVSAITRSPPIMVSPGLKRKYTIGGGFPPLRTENEQVRLVSLTRSSSFQGGSLSRPMVFREAPIVESRPPLPPLPPQPPQQQQQQPQPVASSVTKSKSTGSMLGSSRGFFGLASKFGLKSGNSNPEQKNKMIPGWLSRTSPNAGGVSGQYCKK